MRLIDADEYKGKCICNHLYSGVTKLIEVDAVPTAFDLESVIKQFEENKIDMLKAIDDNAIRDCYILNKTDVKKLFEDYTKEQIRILKSAVGENIGQK